MDKVEKVARAIYEARGAHEPPRAWRKWEDIGDEARAVWCQCAVAAIVAMGEPASHPLNTSAVVSHEPANVSDKPVAWERRQRQSETDEWGRWHPITEGLFNSYGPKEIDFERHVQLRALYASPRPEAVGEALKLAAVYMTTNYDPGEEQKARDRGIILSAARGVGLGRRGEAAKAEMQASDKAIADLVRLVVKIEHLADAGNTDGIRKAIGEWRLPPDAAIRSQGGRL